MLKVHYVIENGQTLEEWLAEGEEIAQEIAPEYPDLAEWMLHTIGQIRTLEGDIQYLAMEGMKAFVGQYCQEAEKNEQSHS